MFSRNCSDGDMYCMIFSVVNGMCWVLVVNSSRLLVVIGLVLIS